MKIAVIGANGQLGSDICSAFKANKDEVIELNHDNFDICDFEKSKETFSKLQPELVINTAAFHNVDKCETEVVRAFEVNAGGARTMAKLSKELGFVLHHISTDYVFDGKKNAPYLENDSVCPVNVYGNSKAAGEFFVKTIAEKSLIIRVSGIYGKNPCRAKGGANFVNLMLRFAKEKPEVRVVNNEFVSPTSTLEIARQLVPLSRSGLYGVCHSTAEGSCSWYEFAQEIFRLQGISTPLNIAQPGEFPVNTPRPFYSVLENSLLKKNNLNIMRHWKDGLAEYLNS
jgi:dTDP-4-dehydrorhamnose reductase